VIGVDYHPSFQQIAFLMEETGEHNERRLNHSEGGRKVLSRSEAARSPGTTGDGSDGFSRWFERLLASKI
jgi:transposase